MAKMSFTDGPEAETNEVAVQEKQEVAQPSQLTGVTGLSGEFGTRDVKLPRLGLLQKMSDLVGEGAFKAGDIVFKSGDITLPLILPAEVSILHLEKKYQEVLPYGSPETPKVFDTAAEVRNAGGSTEYGDENYYAPLANVQVLFAAPADIQEDLRDLFPFSFDGQDYAIAMMTLSKSAYTSGAKPIITAFNSYLRGKHWTGKWVIGSDKKSGGGNTWHVPTFKAAGRHDEAFAEFAQSLVP